MIGVRTQTQDRLNRKAIHSTGRFIYECSRDCDWMFYFEDCGIANDYRQCPLCRKEIGARQYGQLIQCDSPQIQMSINNGLARIE